MSPDAQSTTYDHYRVIRTIGQGGMGAVYLAEDTLLGRQVAVKVPLLSKKENPQVAERFLREARAAASITHPNICPVLHVGEQGDGYYFVMPYLEGTPLNRLINPANPWQISAAVDLVSKMASGVQAIHDKGLIHRDLKPGNVLLLDGEPIILDLGLARSLAEEGEKLTGTGQALGTPAYMAPEQLMGKGGQLSPATDVYALGVILYQLLTGRLPFDGPVHAVYAQILQNPPPAPSALRPDLDPRLDALCQQAMAKEPGERPASARVFAERAAPCRGSGSGTQVLPPTVNLPAPPTALAAATVTDSGAVECPRCGKRLKLPPGFSRPQARCPGCKTHLALVGADAPDSNTPRQKTATGGSPSRAGRRLATLVVLTVVVGLIVVGAGGAGLWWLLGPSAPPPKTFTNSLGMKLVRVPAGTFVMGSPKTEADREADEEQHEVEISQPFYLSAHEVTQSQFKRVMGYNPSYHATQAKGKEGVSYSVWPGSGSHWVDDHIDALLPVENVTHAEALEFCKKLSELPQEAEAGRSYRLPTEAEWEYACREAGAQKGPYSTGDKLSDTLLKRQSHPIEVGSNEPNALGLYDLHGGVREWCADWYDPAYYSRSPRGDPPGPAEGDEQKLRVIRGGAYGNPALGRSAERLGWEEAKAYSDLGFRVVCVLKD